MVKGASTNVVQATHGTDLGQPGVIMGNGHMVAFIVEVNINFVAWIEKRSKHL